MDIFAVIADPTRRAILDMMRHGERPAGDFVAAFSTISQPAISQHLKILRDSGLVVCRAEKQRRYYALRTGALASVSAWIQTIEGSPYSPDATPPRKSAPKPKQVSTPTPVMLDLFG